MENPYLEVLTVLQGSKYVVIGGFAAIMYGSNRFTPDLNIVLDFDPTNIRETVSKLAALGLRYPARINPIDLIDSHVRKEWMEQHDWRFLPFESPSITGFRVEISLDPKPTYSELILDAQYYSFGNTTVSLCSYEKLCVMKRAASRPQDLIDIENLAFASALQATSNEPIAIKQLMEEYHGKFEPERLEHLLKFSEQSPESKVEWLGNMLQAIGKSMLGQLF